jgi:hypothetical protein
MRVLAYFLCRCLEAVVGISVIYVAMGVVRHLVMR